MATKLNSMFLVRRRWWLILSLGLLALLLAHGMALIYRIQPVVSLWFPPSGVAIALTLWLGPIGAVLTGLASVLMAPLWGNGGWTRIAGLTDAIEPLVAWFLYRYCWQGSLSLSRLRDAVAFTLSAPVAACATSAITGSLVLVAMGNMSMSNLATSIPHWWLGNAIGTMAIAPTLLLVLPWFLHNHKEVSALCSLKDVGIPRLTPFFWVEAAVILALSVGTAELTVSKTHVASFAFQQFSFLGFIPILWAATRFGVTGGMLTSSFCVFVTLLAYLINYPNAISLPSFPVPPEVLHVHKLSLLVQCAVSLFVGCASTERAGTKVALAVERVRAQEHEARAQLTEQLIQLNRELTQANRRLEESNHEKEEWLRREQMARAESEVARQAAEEAKEQVSRILESITDGFIAFDREWGFTYINREAAQLLGRSRDELLGRNLWEELPEFYNTNFKNALAEGIPLELEDYYAPLNVWFAVRVYPSEAGLSVYFHNVTERKQAEETLRQSEERLRLALDAGKAGVWDWDMVNNHVTWSERIYEFHGLTPETFDGNVESFLALIYPEERERVATAIQKAIEDKVPYHIEFRAVQPSGGVRWISTNGRVIYDATGKPIRMLGATIDTTERKTAEEEREQLLERERTARTEAEAANRIKDEFLTVLSHELRTPLNPILGWSKLLQSGKCHGETMTRALDAIERNAKLQKQLIEDLLDVSRMLQGKLSLNVLPVNLVSIIQSAIETLRLAAQAKSIQIQTLLEPNLGLVSGDPNRLQQVVWNLLSNAIKFTPSGGRVKIRLSAIALGTGNYAQIQVSDTGHGINPEFLPFVFDRFRQANSTTTRTAGGLGIGLSLVRYLVELHGGTIEAESIGEGQGATFTLILPLMNWVPKSSENEVLPDNAPNLAGIKVLVVDDNVDTLEVLFVMLQQYGADVMVVDSAHQAFQCLIQWQPDVLLSDIAMPDMDGYMLIERIRALPAEVGGQILAIALTAYAEDTDHQLIFAAGFNEHITKPVEPAFLATVITNLVSNR